MKVIRKFFSDESGATMVEYGLMVALIAIVAIGAVTLLGQEVDQTFTTVGDAMESANNAAP